MKILVIEGDTRRAHNIRHALAEHGHVVDTCADGSDGQHMALVGAYDLLILDHKVAGTSALEILGSVRQRHSMPVILTGEADDPDERAHALRLGADDYLVRPVSMSELLARVHVISRRRGSRDALADRLIVSDLEIDLVRRQARRAGRLLALSAQEFKLLALLARHSGTVLCRAQVREQLWDEDFESDSNVVEVAIRRLRAKIDRPFPTPLLHTVRGVGYVLDEQSRST